MNFKKEEDEPFDLADIPLARAPTPRREVSCFEQLSRREKRMVDDLINHLACHNKSRENANAVTRQQFWNHVFRDTSGQSWNTERLYEEPKVRVKQVIQSRVEAGSLKATVPPSADALQTSFLSRHGLLLVTPYYRQYGAAAYLQPLVDWNIPSIEWRWADVKNNPLPKEYVNMHVFYSREEYHIAALEAWDRAEIKAVGGWNMEMAIYWARCRLMFSVLGPGADLPHWMPAESQRAAFATNVPVLLNWELIPEIISRIESLSTSLRERIVLGERDVCCRYSFQDRDNAGEMHPHRT